MPRSELIAFRRGTAAQWAAANPVLLPGEPGYETDTGLTRVGDGLTAFVDLGTIGERTDHDAIRWFAGEKPFEGSATYTPNAASQGVPAYYAFANAAENFIKWTWQPEDYWGTYTIRGGFVHPGVEAVNPTRWRYSEERIVVNANQAGGGSFVEAPATIAEITVPAAPGTTGTTNQYLDIVVGHTAVPALTIVHSVLTRLGNAAEDTFVGAYGVYLVTATRVGV